MKASDNPFVGMRPIESASALLAAGGLDPAVELKVRLQLGAEWLEHGDADAGRRQAEAALALAESSGQSHSTLRRAVELCALASLRQAEIENCVERHASDCCILPLAGGGIHQVRAPAADAKAYYERSLRMQDRLEIRWMLNVASMALGEYPEGVPERYRVPSAAFASEHDIGRFEDVAAQAGVDAFNLAGGCMVEDFDGDGTYDIVTSTSDLEGPLRFYHGKGDLMFEDRSEEAGLSEQLGGLNVIAGDYDDDGDMDLLVLRGAWMLDDGCIPNSLIRNDGDGTFTDVTEAAGLLEARPTQTACFGDFDNDGDLDLFVGNESRAGRVPGRGDYPSQLFRNDGDGTFTDCAAESGVENDRYCKGVTAGDYDNDGDLDIYVSNVGPNRLYRNDGNLRFTDVASQLRVAEPSGRSFATWFFDYDNDGWLDLFVAAYESTVEDVVADLLDLPNGGTAPRLYRNEGGRFRDVSAALGLRHAWLPMGANFGDLDNDGWLDVYLGTGDPSYETLVPNVMLRNDAANRFQDVTTSGGFGHLQKGHGVAFADLDRDGDQDVYHQLGGFYPGDAFSNALFRNPGHGHHWLQVRLRGTRTNRFGIGARIRVVVERAGVVREIHRAVGSVSSFGGSPFAQEIGLGDCDSVRFVEVTWPVSRTRQVVEDLALDTRIEVFEGDATRLP